MKKYNLLLLNILANFVLLTFLFNINLFAQEEEEIPEKLKYVREKYEETFQADFDKVWNSVLKFVEEKNCGIESQKVRQNDAGKQRGICKTALCVFASGTDSTFNKIQEYGLNPPFIRGGVWTSGRIQYRFIVEDLGSGIHVEIRSELSGFEEHATFKAHFFDTNGLLEFLTFEKLREMINSN